MRRASPALLLILVSACAAREAPTPSPTPTAPEPETPTHAPVELLGGGQEWGSCAGTCRFELGIGDRQLSLTVREFNGSPELASSSGVLTDLGANVHFAAENSLRGVRPRSVYGCPDCNDGGASWIRIRRGEIESEHRYPYGMPPDELRDCDALVSDLVLRLRLCSDGDNLTVDRPCTPVN